MGVYQVLFHLFSYDECGNILSKKVTSLLDANSVQMFACVYDKKKLASYNGESCAFGNNNKLVRWRNKTVEWLGRKLTKLGTTTFSYDGFGNRIAKNGILFTYDSQGNLIEQSNGLRFMYDHTGVMGFEYEGSTYVYQKDILGNIVAIVDSNGEIVASYVYDAWGNHKIYDSIGSEYSRPTFIGNLNPFRYRGYYYDSETGLYYLKSRYYDPEVGRFISADTVNYAEPSKFGGLNLYAYCNNNPVMFVDPSGNSISMLAVFLIFAVIGAAAGTGIAIHKKKKGWDFVKTVLIGIGIGLAAAGLGIAAYSAGVGASAAISGKLVKAMAFGMTVKRAFSIGALAYNTFAFVVAPLIGIDDMEGIEVGPIAPGSEGASGVVPSGYIK